MKVVVNGQNDKVVGIHLVGAEVAEILQVTFITCCLESQCNWHMDISVCCVVSVLPADHCFELVTVLTCLMTAAYGATCAAVNARTEVSTVCQHR